MSNLSVAKTNATPFQNLVTSTPAKFAKDNPVLTGAAILGSGVIAKSVADNSQIGATVIKKGVVPLLGGGAALLGASMLHDAVKGGSKDASGLARLGQGAGGAALVLAGSEVAGRSFGVSPLKALGKVLDNPVGTATAFALPGIGAAAWGISDMKKDGLQLGNAAATGLGVSWTAAQGVMLANTYGSATVQKVAEHGIGIVGGASLGLGALALGKQAYTEVQNQSWTKAALFAGGATAAGVASAHILGNATGIDALSNLAGKAFSNPLLAGSIAVVGLTGVAYVAYSNQKDKEETKPETKPAAK